MNIFQDISIKYFTFSDCFKHTPTNHNIMRQLCSCSKLAQKQYKEKMTILPEEYIHWVLESSHRWYEHTPAEVMENDEGELYIVLSRHHTTDLILS